MEIQIQTEDKKIVRLKKFVEVYESFVTAAKTYAKVILSEMNQPDEKGENCFYKTIRKDSTKGGLHGGIVA